jgi:hypothetical protein
MRLEDAGFVTSTCPNDSKAAPIIEATAQSYFDRLRVNGQEILTRFSPVLLTTWTT